MQIAISLKGIWESFVLGRRIWQAKKSWGNSTARKQEMPKYKTDIDLEKEMEGMTNVEKFFYLTETEFLFPDHIIGNIENPKLKRKIMQLRVAQDKKRQLIKDKQELVY